MNKIVFAFILLVLSLNLAAQADITSILQPAEKEKPLLEQLKEEKRELAILEKEVSYYYNLLQQKTAVSELYEKGKITNLKNVFSKTAKIIDFIIILSDFKR